LYVDDTSPGIRRRRSGKGFAFTTPDGQRLKDARELARIKALGIPPAWTDVWICPSPRGHIQATGRDVRGRKQYRYHTRWREVRDETKYHRMIAFALVLPNLRARVDEDLRRPGLPREKVLATVLRLLETTLVRVGNEEYARQNDSFGLTTLRDEHAEIDGSTIRFRFRGKSGKEHEVDVRDRRVARIVQRCQDLPGNELFQYVDEQGQVVKVTSGDVNEYLRSVTGDDFSAKDFRTWAGTVLAARALSELSAFDSAADAKRNVVKAIEEVAKRLGNTRAICKRCYVHPAIIDAYLEGAMIDVLRQRAEAELATELAHLPPEEAAVLGLLQQRLAREQEPLASKLSASVAAAKKKRAASSAKSKAAVRAAARRRGGRAPRARVVRRK
jgi:DNA topoisomerase-1